MIKYVETYVSTNPPIKTNTPINAENTVCFITSSFIEQDNSKYVEVSK